MSFQVAEPDGEVEKMLKKQYSRNYPKKGERAVLVCVVHVVNFILILNILNLFIYLLILL